VVGVLPGYAPPWCTYRAICHHLVHYRAICHHLVHYRAIIPPSTPTGLYHTLRTPPGLYTTLRTPPGLYTTCQTYRLGTTVRHPMYRLGTTCPTPLVIRRRDLCAECSQTPRLREENSAQSCVPGGVPEEVSRGSGRVLDQ